MNHISLEDFNELVKYISENHGFRSCKPHRKMIKYVRCSFDTRFGDIFNVVLDDVVFSVVNENRKRNLKKWIYAYLNDEDDGFDPIRDDPEMNWGELIPGLKAARAASTEKRSNEAGHPQQPQPTISRYCLNCGRVKRPCPKRCCGPIYLDWQPSETAGVR